MSRPLHLKLAVEELRGAKIAVDAVTVAAMAREDGDADTEADALFHLEQHEATAAAAEQRLRRIRSAMDDARRADVDDGLALCATIAAAIELCRARCWRTRVAASRDNLGHMLTDAAAEEARQTALLDGGGWLAERANPPTVTLEGARADLAAAVDDAARAGHGVELDEPVLPSAQRDRDRHAHSRDLLLSFRRVTHAADSVVGMPLLRLLRDAHDHSRSRAAQAVAERLIDTTNSIEGNAGYVRETLATIAALKLPFRVIPAGDYTVGVAADAAGAADEPWTLLPVTASGDRCMHYDQRTPYWLASPQRDAQSHGAVRRPAAVLFASTPRRTAAVDAWYVAEAPLTIGQYRRLLQHRRFGKLLPVLPRRWLERRLVACPTFFGDRAAQVRLVDGGAAADDDALEVPYFVAAQIAAAVGCYVPPDDVFEAACRGVEGNDYAFDAATAALLETAAVPYGAAIGGGRVVETLLSRSDAPLDAMDPPSPFGMRGVLRRGAEWNSVSPGTTFVCRGGDALPFTPQTHVLRSAADHGTQQTCGDGDEHHRGFVGPALHTCGVPNRGTPLAAVRLALPLFAAGHARHAATAAASAARCGATLDSAVLVSGFTAPMEAWFRALAPLAPDETATDALYGAQCMLQLAAGFDAVFAAEYPHALEELIFYAAPHLGRGDQVDPVERATFAHDIVTDNSRITLPIADVDAWRCGVDLAGVAIVEDRDGQLAFTDSIAVPRLLHAAHPATLRVRLELRIDHERAVRKVTVICLEAPRPPTPC
jgi:hypothetical protein